MKKILMAAVAVIFLASCDNPKYVFSVEFTDGTYYQELAENRACGISKFEKVIGPTDSSSTENYVRWAVLATNKDTVRLYKAGR